MLYNLLDCLFSGGGLRITIRLNCLNFREKVTDTIISPKQLSTDLIEPVIFAANRKQLVSKTQINTIIKRLVIVYLLSSNRLG